jgi:hypothetical protein
MKAQAARFAALQKGAGLWVWEESVGHKGLSHVCVCVCVWLFVCVYVYICVYECVCSMCLCVYPCVSACVVCVPVCMSVCVLHVCLCVCVCLCTHTCACMCISSLYCYPVTGNILKLRPKGSFTLLLAVMWLQTHLLRLVPFREHNFIFIKADMWL